MNKEVCKRKTKYSELLNKCATHPILSETIFPPLSFFTKTKEKNVVTPRFFTYSHVSNKRAASLIDF